MSLAGAVDAAGALGANLLVVWLYRSALGGGSYAFDLSAEAFEGLLERSARLVRKRARVLEFRSYHMRDLVCEVPRALASEPDSASPQQPHMQPGPRVFRRKLLSAAEVRGMPLLALAFEHDRLPFNAFPCGAQLHDVRSVRQVRVPLDAGAVLVLETHSQDRGAAAAQPGAAAVRSAFVEIQLQGSAAESAAAATAALQQQLESVVLGRE